MFNVGPLELVAIALVALVVLGPERLPDAARKAGKLMGDLRQLSAGFQREVQQAFEEHGGSGSAMEAVDTLRSITGGPLGPVRAGLNAAVASVSSQAKATMSVEGAPGPRPPAARKKAPAAKKSAPRKKAPAKKAAPVRKPAPAKAKATTAAKKAPAKRAPAKKVAAKKSATVPKAARPRRSA